MVTPRAASHSRTGVALGVPVVRSKGSESVLSPPRAAGLIRVDSSPVERPRRTEKDLSPGVFDGTREFREGMSVWATVDRRPHCGPVDSPQPLAIARNRSLIP